LLPVHVTHRAYQERQRESVVRLVAENPVLGKDIEAYADTIGLFYAMDPERAAPILRANYSRGGPLAIDPVVMLRAILLMFYLRIQSFGALVQRLAGSALLRAFVGCEDPPGRTTFYDLCRSRHNATSSPGCPGSGPWPARPPNAASASAGRRGSTRRDRRNRCCARRRCSSWSICATRS